MKCFFKLLSVFDMIQNNLFCLIYMSCHLFLNMIQLFHIVLYHHKINLFTYGKRQQKNISRQNGWSPDSGFSAGKIKARLELSAYDASIYITVNSLEYLKKSGRITASAAAIAGILNIKPVLTIQGDKLDLFAKVRGIKQSERKMIEALKQDIATRFADIPAERLRIAAAGTFEKEEEAEAWRSLVQSAFPHASVYYAPLSCSIACHVSVGACGIAVSILPAQ